MLSTVLLPDPDGPSSATNSPWAMVKETSFTASSSPAPNRNDIFNRRTSTRAGTPRVTVTRSSAGGIGLLGGEGEARIDDPRHWDRFDAGQFAEPDFRPAVITRL